MSKLVDGSQGSMGLASERRTTSSLAPAKKTSSAAKWGGWIMGLLPSLFLLMDGAMKLFKPRVVIEGTAKVGFPEDVIIPLGIVLIASTLLYLIPRTAVLGAILLTGYLGGAVATHVRIHDPIFSHMLFPVYFGALLWGGLYLRDRRVRALLPLRMPPVE